MRKSATNCCFSCSNSYSWNLFALIWSPYYGPYQLATRSKFSWIVFQLAAPYRWVSVLKVRITCWCFSVRHLNRYIRLFANWQDKTIELFVIFSKPDSQTDSGIDHAVWIVRSVCSSSLACLPVWPDFYVLNQRKFSVGECPVLLVCIPACFMPGL